MSQQTFSPNSTSKELTLKKMVYGEDNFESYYITNQEVAQVLEAGFIPQITLPKVDENTPRIAVVLGLEKHPDRQEKDYYIHPDYVEAIVTAGGNPIFIAYDKIQEQLELAKPQAIFLIGGSFNSPAQWYKVSADEDVDKRGAAYLEMLDYAKEKKLPVLGICAGMQMLAGYLGAKMQKGINEGRAPEKSHKQNGEKFVHKVLIEESSLLSKIVQTKEIMTNSSHNEAIIEEDCGNNKITAKAEDGIVEAIEPIDGWHGFLLGVQWHPERLLKYGDKPSSAIFNAFVESCKNNESHPSVSLETVKGYSI